MKDFKTVVIVVLIVLSVVIFIQNTDVVPLRFLFWELAVPRIILIPYIMVTGFILGYVVGTKRKKR